MTTGYEADALKEKEEAEQILELIKATEVASPADGEIILASVIEKRDELRQMEEIALEGVQSIKATFDLIFRAFDEMQAILRSRILVARSRIECAVQEAIRALEKAQRRGDEEEIALAIEAYYAICPEDAPPPEPGRWDFEVTDIEKIPANFLVVNQPALFRHVQLYRDQTDIQGIRVFRR